MAISITQLLQPLDKVAVLKDLYAFGQALGLTTTAWEDGEPVPVVLDMFTSLLVDKLWNPYVVPALSGPFLDYSSGNWLTLEAWSRYFRPRILSTYATGPITLQNQGSYVGTIGIGQARIKNSVTGYTYTNTTAGFLSAWTGSPAPYPTVTLTFQADVTGSVANAQPSQIATNLVAGPANVFAVTNGAPLVGADQEPDDRLITRLRAAAAELSSSGPSAAYIGVAMDPLGSFTRRGLAIPSSWGTTAPSISRVRIVDTGAATVSVYLASSSGPASGNSSTDGTDVYKANVALQLFVVPPGTTVAVVPANVNNVALGTITLYLDAATNVTAADAIAGANLSLANYFATLAIGGARKVGGGTGYLFADQVRDAAGKWQQSASQTDGSTKTYYSKIPGLLTVDLTLADTALGAGDVVVATWTVQANIVSQT